MQGRVAYWLAELHTREGAVLSPPIYATSVGRRTVEILQALAFEDLDRCADFCEALSRRTLELWAPTEHVWEPDV